ncbi:hypothetical protein N781_05385 [Pontibacillus halophilus JSM 076056 = DSM 19796]|uniref:Uncharacterized protein n=1 Tax=Pontibacillus halophilus JSM 076056 = DSM 19796 TaxID=1385510 RepID=A0A0A5I5S6_9BACI|nr:hypothetical protein [Pontibacillus halophilus]KGX91182.1 hypothetical protein N781_05385 [Pontibacillus halophilus JSM 076056 = DSM 19796]
MRKVLFVTFASLMACSACSGGDTYTYWTDTTENQIQRLDEASINYEIRDDEIWVDEEEMDKVVACCS